ncbi:MAG: glycosyltransferase family 39 protein [Flavobacteriales bacterium]|nr:glycosyltransferase family 39 protein [Flavobacteriales bacterium]
MKIRMSWLPRLNAGWWFAIAFVLMCCAYEYGRVLHLRPQPHHLMRQCDCLGPAYNYFVGDPNLFHPWMCNLHADKDTSGESAGEFPLIYWLMGMLWRVIGHSEFAYRLFGLLLHFIGSFALFRTAQRILRSDFWSGWLSLLFFTSPAIVYFAVSFLPDVPAFDLALIGWWCFTTYHLRHQRKWLFAALFFMALGALLKITAGMSLLALLGVLCFETLFKGRMRHRWLVFPQTATAFAAFAGAITMVLSWYVYAAKYNAVHNAPYTPNSLWPIWKMTAEEFDRATTFGKEILVFELFGLPVWTTFIVLASACFIGFRKAPIQVALLNGALLFGTFLYLMGWFQALNNHDYYFINPMIMLVAISVSGLWYLRQYQMDWLVNPWTKGIALAVLIHSTMFAASDAQLRFRNGKPLAEKDSIPLVGGQRLAYWKESQYWLYGGLLDIEPYLRSLGITHQDRVIIAPDRTWQNSLYLSGQRGWNDFTMHLKEPAQLDQCVASGALYLLLLEEEWTRRPHMQHYVQYPIGEHKGVRVYDLRPLRTGAEGP